MTQRSGSQRQLRTVLFTDIVGSTDMAAELGDQRWRALVSRHHQAIRRELKRHRGREVDTAGDGFFAVFEHPTDGVRCAAAAVAAVHGLGLRIRAGLHTGEIEVSGEKAGGIAVHIGARLAAMAGPEEVLVSGTVHDLVAGSGLEFEDRGSHELKGVPGTWQVHALVLPPLDASVVVAAEQDEAMVAGARRRQRVIVGVLVAALAVVLIGVLGVQLIPPPAVPTISGPDTVVAFAAADGRPVTGVRTGRGPGAVDAVDGAIWVANTGGATATRIEIDGGASTTVGQVGSRPTAVTGASGLVWTADRYTDVASILDARTGDLQRHVDVHASALDAGRGGIWATDDLRDVVRRLDARTGVELGVTELPAGSGPWDVDASGDAVWVAAARSGRLLRIDPGGGGVDQAAIQLPGVERVSAAGSAIWAVSPALDTIIRADAATSRVAVRATVCDNPVAVAAVPDDGGAWIVCSTARTLWHVDQAGQVDRQVALDAVPTDVVLDDDRVWVTLRED